MTARMEKFDSDPSTDSMSEIQSFFKDTSVFVTGATGFLGHVLLAKLLRTCPDVKKIYVLLRNKKGKSVSERFQALLEDEVFQVMKAECPEAILKIHPISGDCLQTKLGINGADTQLLKDEVDVVFHVAATVKFDAPLKYAVNMNIRSTSDLLDLAHDMNKLKAFVHVSTAFSNCVGRDTIEEKLYSPPIPPEQLMMLVENLDEKIVDSITPSLLGSYPNTYVYTKGIAEDMCRLKGADLPLTIFRPAIVISTVKEPLPGWINNVYGPTGVVAAAAVGLLHVLQVDKNSRANIVPCDYVVNAAIAAAWSIGTKSTVEGTNSFATNGILPVNGKINGKIVPDINLNENIPNENMNGITTRPDKQISHANLMPGGDSAEKKIPIYNYSCDLMEKPFTWSQFMKMNEYVEPEVASAASIWAYSLTLVKNKTLYQLYCFMLHLFPAFLADSVARLIGKQPKLLDAYYKLHKLSDVLSYFSTRQWKVTNDNVHSLWDNLSIQDKELFDFNLNNVDWMTYYRDHCFGIRKFILKEDPKTIPFSQRRRLVLRFLHYLLLSALTFSSLYMVFKLTRFVLS